MHAVTIPFVMLHWYTNQTVCALTEMEKLVSGNKEEDTFFGQIFVQKPKVIPEIQEELLGIVVRKCSATDMINGTFGSINNPVATVF